MASLRFSIIVPLLITLLCSSHVVVNVSARPRVWVHVFNKCQSGLDILLHCWSSEDDLGLHVLKHDQMYQFTFCPNIWGSTKFECRVQFGDGSEKQFMVYKFSRDSGGCRHCIWHLRENKACQLLNGEWVCYDYY
uniref:S-protein homolog n=1 Tax=Kalanchoe fedtschenkoi TaxID=63787 RepID=A0A7N0VMK2_KALFE